MLIAHAYRLASARLARLRECQYGATVAEYAIGAAMIAAAWASGDAPGLLAGESQANAVETCTYSARGTTPRWERPAPRCTAG